MPPPAKYNRMKFICVAAGRCTGIAHSGRCLQEKRYTKRHSRTGYAVLASMVLSGFRVARHPMQSALLLKRIIINYGILTQKHYIHATGIVVE